MEQGPARKQKSMQQQQQRESAESKTSKKSSKKPQQSQRSSTYAGGAVDMERTTSQQKQSQQRHTKQPAKARHQLYNVGESDDGDGLDGDDNQNDAVQQEQLEPQPSPAGGVVEESQEYWEIGTGGACTHDAFWDTKRPMLVSFVSVLFCFW